MLQINFLGKSIYYDTLKNHCTSQKWSGFWWLSTLYLVTVYSSEWFWFSVQHGKENFRAKSIWGRKGHVSLFSTPDGNVPLWFCLRRLLCFLIVCFQINHQKITSRSLCSPGRLSPSNTYFSVSFAGLVTQGCFTKFFWPVWNKKPWGKGWGWEAALQVGPGPCRSGLSVRQKNQCIKRS